MEPTTQPTPRSSRKAGVIGGVLGSIGIVASIFALSATAGAAPSLVAQDTEPSTPAPVEEAIDAEEVEDEDYEVPEELKAAEECFNALEAKFELQFDGDADGEINEDTVDWEAFDAEALACEDLLPQDVKDQIAAENAQFEAYDTCVNDAFEAIDAEFGDGDFEFGPEVMVQSGDSYSVAEFGEGNGVVTITKTGDDITVDGTGDVRIENIDLDALFGDVEGDDGIFELEEGDFDDAEFGDFDEDFENALAGCEDKLPEGIDLDSEGILHEDTLDEAEAN